MYTGLRLPWPPSSSATSSSWLGGPRSGAASLALMNASFVACLPLAFVQTLHRGCTITHTRSSVLCRSLASGAQPRRSLRVSTGTQESRFWKAFCSSKLVKLSCTLAHYLLAAAVTPQSSNPGWILSPSGCFIALSAGVRQ